MKSSQRRNKAALAAAYQSGFEAGADEAIKRLSAKIALLTDKVDELQAEKQTTYNQMLQARLRAVRALGGALNELT